MSNGSREKPICKNELIGCLENSDRENSDPRPEKLRPSGVSKTQTPDPKNSDPRVSRKLRPRKNSDPRVSRKLRPKKLRPLDVS